MQRTYLDVFDEALNRYKNQADRPGYEPTLFSRFRHSQEKYLELKLFEQELNTPSIVEQKEIVKKWLTNPRLKNNNHSFRTYLIDVLIEEFANEHWDEYDDKKIIFYDPNVHTADTLKYLYRGSMQSPKEAFEKGMKSIWTPHNIEDFTAVVTESSGVSTSKNASVANLYSSQIRTDHYGIHEFYGYVYQIHYRGNEAIDIDETQRARQLNYPRNRTKQEVNIIRFIPPEDIVGCGYVKNEIYTQTKSNPKYLPEKEPIPIKNKAELLNQVFNDSENRLSCTIL